MKGFKKSSLVRTLSSKDSSPAETPTSEAPTSPPIPEESGGTPETLTSPPLLSPSLSSSGDEKKSKSKIPPPPPPDPVRTEEYVMAAEERMAEIDRLLSEIRTKKAKMTNEVARKIFQAVGSCMPVLEAVASLHPISDNVFKVFSGVYALEKMRQDHDEDIAEVFYSATIAIWSLHNLSKLVIEEDMKPKFDSILQKVEKTLSDFGQHVVDYYSQNKAVRLIKIHGASGAVAAFKGEFDNSKVELQWFIDTHTAVATQRGINNTNSKLDKYLTKMENQSETMKTLSDNVRKGRDQFDKMQQGLNSQFSTVLDAINKGNLETREAIIKRLEEGPHELINDMDLKSVWKEMRWRNTIKCRHFLDAVQDFYFQQFAKQLKATSNFHKDQWTNFILSKSIWYAGVGDAIDGDSSGFISVTELNDFLALRPQGWTVPEWLTFWAVGWSQCNVTYRTRIHDKWQEITDKTSGLVAAFGADHEFTRFINETEVFIKSAVGVPEKDFEDDLLPAEVEAELFRLNTKYRRWQEEELTVKVQENVMQEQEDIVRIMGQPRIELSLMPLVYVWLTYFADKVEKTAGEDNVALLVPEFIVARKTMEAMLHRRTGELVQIWSQQKEHLPTQVAGFCGGVLESYYDTTYEKLRAHKKASKLRAYRQDLPAETA
ncbi:hypothetical protein EIP91_002455 [Steccherinum ochraceum]|uniref:EF-hand domain-containing protein n=1 Tax=Steccherinum ochraceum TaxID=92696 RepID=A0A4R0RP07_9APHY|nr:hypothetical protein EIP91_002455 [Steccherinum ochraceum]